MNVCLCGHLYDDHRIDYDHHQAHPGECVRFPCPNACGCVHPVELSFAFQRLKHHLKAAGVPFEKNLARAVADWHALAGSGPVVEPGQRRLTDA